MIVRPTERKIAMAKYPIQETPIFKSIQAMCDIIADSKGKSMARKPSSMAIGKHGFYGTQMHSER